MATLQEICYSCYSDLSSEPNDCVITRNKNDEYSCLYFIVIHVLNNEKLEMQPEKIHQTIFNFFCFSLRVNPNSLSTSLILKTTFAVNISPRFKHFSLMILVFHTTSNCIPTPAPFGDTKVNSDLL